MAKNTGALLIKISLLAAFCIFLWWELFHKQDILLLLSNFRIRLSESNPLLLYLAMALVPVNWLLESLKWWLLVLEFEKINFVKAIKAVLTGVAIGIFTPGRIGEYGGRAISISAENIVESVVATFLGSISQLLATILFGYIGAICFLHHFSLISGLILWFFIVFGAGSFLLLLFLYYNAGILVDIAAKFYRLAVKRITLLQHCKQILSRWLEHVKVLQKYSSNQLSIALFTSAIRYFVYSSQYLLLLNFMGIETDFSIGISAVATVFLLQSSIPLPPVSGLIIRGGTALYIWQYISANQVAILATTLSLWLMNVIIPALIGMVLLINTDIFRTNDR